MLNTFQKYFFNLPSSALALVMIFALVICLWLPFGLNRTVPAFEEWTVYTALQQGKPWLFIAEEAPTRPLIYAVYNLITLLSFPDLPVGYNLTLMGLFIAKAWFVYLILRRLIPQNPYIPLMTALLFIVYPADTGLFTFRAMGTQISLVLGLIAIYLLLRLWQQPRFWVWLVTPPIQVLCLWIMEGMFPVVFVAPFLLLWIDRRFSWRFWKVSVLWLIIPTVLFSMLVWSLVVPGNSGTYITRRIDEAQAQDVINISTMLNRTVSLYVRHISEWATLLTEFSRYASYLPVGLGVGLLMGVVSWQYLKGNPIQLTRGNNFLLLLAGLAIILIGYSPYLLVFYQYVHWRVYLISSLGAALFVSVVLYWLARRLRLLAIFLSVGLLALASVSALGQHAFYADTSVTIQRLFAQIVAQAPRVDPKATIILLDVAGNYRSQWATAAFDRVLSSALSYLYGYPVKAAYCTVNQLSMWGEVSCDMGSLGIHRVFRGRHFVFPYRQMIVFRAKENGEVDLIDQLPGAQGYNPSRLIDHDAPAPDMVHVFFTCWPLDSCFPLNTPPQAEIRLDFDRMIRGFGWESGDPDRHQMWMAQSRRSTIIVNPVTDRPLEIQFRISNAVGQDVINSLIFEVNRHVVKLEKIDPVNQIFQAIIPPAFLQAETELAFNVNRVAGLYDLSLEFDWLQIRPVERPNRLRVEFDSPIDGTGWEQPTADQSQLWTLEKRATMNFHLPTDSDLEVQFKIDLALQQDILDSLRVTVNGEPLTLEKNEDATPIFRAIIPKALLRDETELAFIVNRLVSPASLGVNSDTRGLGLLFDWLEIRPVP